MRTLVTVSSRHGATRELGDAIADTLRSAGIEVDIITPEVRMIHSPWGDYRPWDDVRDWAQSIATSIGDVAVRL